MEKLPRSALMRQLPVLVAKLQASLHEIDSTGLYKQLSDSALNDWLVENTPGQPDNPVVCHGDFLPNNILYANRNVTGVIDWGNVMFTHPEFDVAITYLAISIGSLNMDPETRHALRPLINSILARYLAVYREWLPLNGELLAYFGALRSAHAYAKVTGAALGIDPPYIAGDGYASQLPPMFNAISRTIKGATGVNIVRE